MYTDTHIHSYNIDTVLPPYHPYCDNIHNTYAPCTQTHTYTAITSIQYTKVYLSHYNYTKLYIVINQIVSVTECGI